MTTQIPKQNRNSIFFLVGPVLGEKGGEMSRKIPCAWNRHVTGKKVDMEN